MSLMQERRRRVLDNATRLSCNSVIAFEPENVFYLTGFWGEGIVVINDDYPNPMLIVPSLEVDRAKVSAKSCDIVEAERGYTMLDKALMLIKESDNVCTDCNDYSIIERLKVRLVEGSRLKHSKDVFYNARMIKDEEEIARIKRGAYVLDKLFEVCEQVIRVGVSEKQLQALLLYEAMQMGAYPPAYRYTLSPLIIASGINSSLPHAEPSSRVIEYGDLVTVDLTLRYEGYVADATRTFAVGRVDEDKYRIYHVVKEAQEMALDALKSNAICNGIDKIARAYIDSKGYGSRFIHSTGHGIGLDVHEPPWIRSSSNDVLREGMTITIEPGIYLEGKYGVRIEDSVLICNGGAEVLNKYPKDLIVL